MKFPQSARFNDYVSGRDGIRDGEIPGIDDPHLPVAQLIFGTGIARAFISLGLINLLDVLFALTLGSLSPTRRKRRYRTRGRESRLEMFQLWLALFAL
jgi:hypothetical protein